MAQGLAILELKPISEYHVLPLWEFVDLNRLSLDGEHLSGEALEPETQCADADVSEEPADSSREF